MEIINQYFKGLLFTKVVENKEGYAIYGAGVSSGIGGGKMRYVLLFVPIHEANQRQGKINELKWKNLQTRTLEDSYKLKTQRWALPKEVPDFLLTVQSRTKKFSTYSSPELPFEILLLHNPRKKTEYQYRNKLTLTAAVDMFETIINYKEPEISYPFIPPKENVFYSSANHLYPSSNYYTERHTNPHPSPADYSYELL